jgi:hypothetical protein
MPPANVALLALSSVNAVAPAEVSARLIGNCTLVGVCAASVPELSTVAVVLLSHAVMIIVTGPVGWMTVVPTTGFVALYPARMASAALENVSVVPLRLIVPEKDVIATGPVVTLGPII